MSVATPGGLGRLLRWSALAGLAACALPASAQTDRTLDGAAFSRDALDRSSWSDTRDTPIFLSGRLQAADGSAPDVAALRFLKDNDDLLGLVEGSAAEIVETRRDDLANTHVRVQQTVNGVPVWGAQSAVHLDAEGAVYAWGGDIHPEATAIRSTTPSLSPTAAITQAEGALEPGTVFRTSAAPEGLSADAPDWTPEADLVIYPADGIYTLAYHVRLFVEAPQPANWEVFVDASSGLVLHRFNSLHTFDPALDRAEARANAVSPLLHPEALVAEVSASSAIGSGSSIFGGSYSIPTYLYQGAYYLYDITRGPQYIRTMTGSNTTSLPGSYVTDADNNFPASAAVDAHYGAVTTFDYFKDTHGRNSYNGSNATITSTVNHRSGYNNAFWNGQQMVYGDGDGSTFIALVSLDIAAHELTHAVTGTSAGLIYQNESGALNEAVSDIMAVMVDRNDYLIGEQSYTPGTSGDALRYLDNPPRGDQPDNYADRYTGSQDNGGVHINSGIANKQAYLLIAGGTFRGQAVQAIGRAKTEQVWYRALVNYFTQSTNFAGAREGTIQAAADLYGAGSAEVASVTNAWAAVGVGSGSSGGGGDTGGGTPEWRYETVTIQSPHNYPNNYNDTKTYSKPGAQRVAMYFQQFDTEDRYDYVYIKDATGATKASYTGAKSAFWAVVDGDAISANLVSDYSVTRYGYRVTRVAYFSGQVLFGIDGEPEGTPMDEPPAEVSDQPALAAANKAVEFGLAVGPNPFRGRSTVFVSLDEAADVRVSVLDMLGREVALVEQGAFEPGVREVALDATDLPAGAYTVLLDADGRRQTQRITILR